MSNLTQTNTAGFEKDVLKSDIPVLVDFSATWCGPCKMLTPVLEDIAKKYAGKAKILKVDVDESQDLAATYNITAVPTLLLFKGGTLVQEAKGALSPRQLSTMLDGVAGTPEAGGGCGCGCKK